MTSERELALKAKAWPFEEARKLLARYSAKPPAKGYVLFETGYGPSGLPHIGTFGEVVRTTMVRQAFQRLSDMPTRLFAFSDDMDGLRKVPDNVPNQEMLTRASRPAADQGARSLRHARELRPSQQRDAARLPRRLRLRVRVPELDRLVQERPVRRGAARGAAALRRGHGDHAADARRGAAADLLAPSCRSAPTTGRVLQVPIVERKPRCRHHRLPGRGRHD